MEQAKAIHIPSQLAEDVADVLGDLDGSLTLCWHRGRYWAEVAAPEVFGEADHDDLESAVWAAITEAQARDAHRIENEERELRGLRPKPFAGDFCDLDYMEGR